MPLEQGHISWPGFYSGKKEGTNLSDPSLSKACLRRNSANNEGWVLCVHPNPTRLSNRGALLHTPLAQVQCIPASNVFLSGGLLKGCISLS